MKSFTKPTPAQSLMVFMTMILLFMVLQTLTYFIKAQFLGGKWFLVYAWGVGAATLLIVTLQALRRIREETYRDPQSVNLEPVLSRRSASYTLFSASAFFVATLCFSWSEFTLLFSALVPLGAKILLGIVSVMLVSLSLTNLRYSISQWQESRKEPSAAR